MSVVTGAVTKFGVGDALPITEQYSFEECGLAKEGTHIDADEYVTGFQGDLSVPVQQGPYKVGGGVKIPCYPAVLANWLPRIMGLTGSAGTSGTKYNFDNDTAAFFAMVDRSAKVHTYAGVKVNKATFRGAKGQPVTMELELMGLTESEGAAGSFPALTVITGKLFAFNTGTINLNGVDRDFDQFEMEIDWDRDPEVFYNSISRVDVPPQNRKVSFKCQVPYIPANADLYNQNVVGAAGTMLFTNGASTLQFNMNTLQVPAKLLPIQGKKVYNLPIEGRVRGTTAGNDELVIESTNL